jgi:hypothetical protein
MPLLTTVASGGVKGLGWSSPPLGEELGGMVLLKPTSIDVVGTSATINTNGSIEFSGITALTMNGIFSANYENYLIVTRNTSTNNQSVTAQLTLNSVPANSGYSILWIAAQNTTKSVNQVTSSAATYIGDMSTVPNGWSCYFYGPHLAQSTAMRSVEIFGQNGAEMFDFASTHSTPTSYDGLKIQNSVGTFSGLISVYGMVGA